VLRSPAPSPGALTGAPTGATAADRAIVTVQLGSAPLEYYLSGLHELGAGTHVEVREIDETGYAPLRKGSEVPPAPGFHLSERRNIHGLIVYRFTSTTPVAISAEALLDGAIAEESRAEVLVPRHRG
jgi:hypothetical protein